MIYTVTVNPSIDYIVQLPQLTLGAVNRMSYDTKLPGGKGINVSRILNQLAVKNAAWGFLGGFTGGFIQQQLAAEQMTADFTKIDADTRINVKIKAGEETEINGQGPAISAPALAAFKDKFDQLQAGDIVVMSGSLPPTLPESFYRDLIPLIKAHGADFVIDTTGQALLDTLSAQPLVIKPNHHELAALFNVELTGDADIVKYGRKLLDLGAKHVLVSMAGDGAFLITPDQVYKSTAPKGTVINSVGAGDSMIAGFVGTFSQTHDPLQSFETGLACGSATAFSEDLANQAKIAEVRQSIHIDTYHN
ncbi:1-phosphofructokinase [Loigolactobacillus coryniformis subsp. coryniformis]|uniref:Tagatose-6-phosphate kinase n=1 Tax=Loigolactobacillus coryniformis subsp. torquens DSM 20004 = KCTC 3535 TaxID=1423822 RepID=A0A2D1KNC7_9LACO|nr:1-phosphofructokinase [Loigolactobacillus coryniformis]ATO43650.1 1-phosphofructokinase [Loigolactobacillus coryniformis subsp. torquens DSM 20004 = KCTC 3535]KRK83645.1 1-phosphofructokinase [Loigolactobacillus coryniformis subsp. torquens DSM 20004 = KCTC 3535]MCL5458517.1 1-phosphofructokinase [Loigolactobacillus coryniformis]